MPYQLCILVSKRIPLIPHSFDFKDSSLFLRSFQAMEPMLALLSSLKIISCMSILNFQFCI